MPDLSFPGTDSPHLPWQACRPLPSPRRSFDWLTSHQIDGLHRFQCPRAGSLTSNVIWLHIVGEYMICHLSIFMFTRGKEYCNNVVCSLAANESANKDDREFIMLNGFMSIEKTRLQCRVNEREINFSSFFSHHSTDSLSETDDLWLIGRNRKAGIMGRDGWIKDGGFRKKSLRFFGLSNTGDANR